MREIKGSTTKSMRYFELGRYPFLYERKYRMIKYWLKLVSLKIVFCIYSILNENYLYEKNKNKQTNKKQTDNLIILVQNNISG